MAVNIYEPRFMLNMVEQIPPLHTFLKTTFFSQKKTFFTNHVDFDVKKRGMAMAPFVSTRIGSTTMDRQGYQTLTYKPPLVAPKRVLTTDDIDKRLPGEALYGGYNPNERALQLLTEDMVELDEMITRREEWMCAQVLFNGKINVVGEGIRDVIEFDFTNKTVLTGKDLWDDPDSDPINDLKEARRIVARTGYTPDVAILSSSAAKAFMDHPKVQKKLNIINFHAGVIEPKILQNGATYYGYIPEAGLYIYSYDGYFTDYENPNPEFPTVSIDSDEFVPATYPLVPEGSVMVASTKMPSKMLYAVINDLKIGSQAKPRVVKIWEQEEPSERYIKISSKPLPCPQELDAWYVLEVLEQED